MLAIKVRQKVGYELQWIQISNDAVAATLSFILSPPLGTYELILESTDLNSLLSPPAVLKTTVITVNVYATNQGAFEYGALPKAGQTHFMSLNYELYAGNQSFKLPVIEHLPGFTISQELQSGVLTTASDGAIKSIDIQDTAFLASIGVTIETLSNLATLRVDIRDKAYDQSTFELTIKSTL